MNVAVGSFVDDKSPDRMTEGSQNVEVLHVGTIGSYQIGNIHFIIRFVARAKEHCLNSMFNLVYKIISIEIHIKI